VKRSEEIRRRHAWHYFDVLAELGRLLGQGSVSQAIAGLDLEWEQIQLGQRRAAATDLKLAHAYASLGLDLLERRRPAAELLRWIDPAVEHATTLDDPLLLAEVLNRRGGLRYLAQDYEGAVRDFEDALRIAEQNTDGADPVVPDYDVMMRAGYRRNLALARNALGDTAAAVESTKRALADIRGRGHVEEESALLGNLGMYADETGALDEAVEYYAEALRLARSIGDEKNIADWTGNLANTLLSLGQLEDARNAARESLQIAERRADRGLESLRLGNLAAIELESGAIDSAAELRQRAYDIALEIHDRRRQAQQLHGLGQIDVVADRWDEARRHFEMAHQLFTDVGDVSNATTSARALHHVVRLQRQGKAKAGLALLQAGEVQRGRTALEDVVAESHAGGDEALEALGLGYLAFGLQLDDRPDEALTLLDRAITLSERAGESALLANHLRQTAEVHLQRGDAECAMHYFRQAVDRWPKNADQRVLGLVQANLASLSRRAGDVSGAIASYVDAVITLRTVEAPEAEDVRESLSTLLVPMELDDVQDALLEIANHSGRIASLTVLLDDGSLLRGPKFVVVLAGEPELMFSDDEDRQYGVDVRRLSGLAFQGRDGEQVRFGQYPAGADDQRGERDQSSTHGESGKE
jgi:tetratricopeptide (TPR) repeat protein